MSFRTSSHASSSLRHSVASHSTSTSTSSTLLQQRINEKRLELETLRQLKNLSAGLATQMEQLETKLSTLSNGTEAVAAVMSNWHNILRAISMASTKLPVPGDVDDTATALPQTLIRIPVQDLKPSSTIAEETADQTGS